MARCAMVACVAGQASFRRAEGEPKAAFDAATQPQSRLLHKHRRLLLWCAPMSFTIDPRVSALLGHDHDLPDVPPERLTRQALAARFAQPPHWQPDIEVERWYKSPNPVDAAVLVPLVMRPDPTVLLTLRTAHLKKHAGQISFPGGRREEGDADLVCTALREAHEEVGLAPERVEVLGHMPTYTTGTGFVVTPVVGLITPSDDEHVQLTLRPDPGEVQEAFEVPLRFLMNPAHHQRRAFEVPGAPIEFYSMPWTSPEAGREYLIWGATAAMLRNLYRFLAA